MADPSLVERGFDELPTAVAILDSRGDIVYTNRAWRTFGSANDFAGDPSTIGVNYLDVCDAASHEDEVAGVVADGIRELIRGDRDLFSAEYPCHSPSEFRWFLMRAVPYDTPRHGRFVVVMHLDITDRRVAELQVNEKNQHLATLLDVLSSELREPLSTAIETAGRLVADESVDAGSLRETLRHIDALVERSVSLADETATVSLEPVDFRSAVERAWGDGGTDDTSLRVVGRATLSADTHLFGLLLRAVFSHVGKRGSSLDRPSEVVVGTTEEGFYVDDDGPRASRDERSVSTGPSFDGVTGGVGETMDLTVAARIADIHGWAVTVGDSELGGARFEVTGVAWSDREDASP